MTQTPTDALRLVQAIRDWLREPDNAESFSFNDLVEWLNRRPVGLVAAALESLAAAPASPLPGGGWQDISTAPKDGTRVLLFSVPNEVPGLRPHIADGYWKDTSGFMAPGLWMMSHSVGPSFTPTHWMPLPAAPTGDA